MWKTTEQITLEGAELSMKVGSQSEPERLETFLNAIETDMSSIIFGLKIKKNNKYFRISEEVLAQKLPYCQELPSTSN